MSDPDDPTDPAARADDVTIDVLGLYMPEAAKEVGGKKYDWCKHHGTGMYMPAPHDHTAWKKRKAEKKQAWEARRQKRDKKGPSADAGGSSKMPDKLTLSKNLRASLVTRFQMSATDADKVSDEAYAESLKE